MVSNLGLVLQQVLCLVGPVECPLFLLMHHVVPKADCLFVKCRSPLPVPIFTRTYPKPTCTHTLHAARRSSYNIMRVKSAFEFAYQQLTAPSSPNESLLARILRYTVSASYDVGIK